MAWRSRRVAAVSVGLAFVLSAPDAGAQVYRWVDGHGNVHYTDQPQRPSDNRPSPTPPAATEGGPARPPAPAPPPAPVRPRSGSEGAVRARPTHEVTVKRSVAPPPTIAGVPIGSADAEQRRAAAIDEIFRLVELPMVMSAMLPEDAAVRKPRRHEPEKFLEKYLPLARRSFRSYFVDQHAEAGIAWLRSPLGRQLSKALGADVANADVEAYAARPDAVSAERRRLLSRFGRASQFPEIAVTPVSVLVLSLQFMMMEMMPQAFEAAAPQANDPGAALLTGLTSGLGAAMREGMKQHTTPEAMRSAVDEVVDQALQGGQAEIQKQLAYRLREVSNDDLAKAIRFYEGDGGRWLGSAVRLASRDATVAMVQDMLKEMRAGR